MHFSVTTLNFPGLRRVCFQLQFERELLEEYLKDHEKVWPEMQQALRDCGWYNYRYLGVRACVT